MAKKQRDVLIDARKEYMSRLSECMIESPRLQEVEAPAMVPSIFAEQLIDNAIDACYQRYNQGTKNDKLLSAQAELEAMAPKECGVVIPMVRFPNDSWSVLLKILQDLARDVRTGKKKMYYSEFETLWKELIASFCKHFRLDRDKPSLCGYAKEGGYLKRVEPSKRRYYPVDERTLYEIRQDIRPSQHDIRQGR